MIKNVFTVDVEDYFQVSAFEPYVPRDRWDTITCRIETNIDKVLGILSEKNINATFFTLGWIAERYPEMVRKIVSEGHELASHGFSHLRVHQMTKQDFLDDISHAKKILEDVAGSAVRGYRAPSFSITRDCWWAFDCIREVGYKYSSSLYPISHDHYGVPDSSRTLFEPVADLIEIPISTLKIAGKNFPASGGGYFRLFPYSVSKWAFNRLNHIDSMPVIFYFHPWEIDPTQPVILQADRKTKFRHYVNLEKMENKIIQLLSDFSWTTMEKNFFSTVNAA